LKQINKFEAIIRILLIHLQVDNLICIAQYKFSRTTFLEKNDGQSLCVCVWFSYGIEDWK